MKASTFLRDRPWIWIIVAFIILITGWVALFLIAKEHAPEPIPLETTELHDNAQP